MKRTLRRVLSWGIVNCALCIVPMSAQTTFTRDTIQLGTDTLLVVETACAPICSSIVRVYDLSWNYIGMLQSPFTSAVFPEAYIENKRLYWRDNTPLMLDDEEKKHLKTEN